MDFASLLGLVFGAAMVVMGMISDPGSFIDYPSMLLVIGGATGATVLSMPGNKFGKIGALLKHVFLWKGQDPSALIEQVVNFAEVARRDGILALQNVTDEIEDPFLVAGINLAVDGTDPEQIIETMQTELRYLDARHEDGKRVFDNIAKFAPAFGMIGTLVGLILMLKNLQDADQLGSGMALALITTLYGAILANLVFMPMADKLAARNLEEKLIKEIIINGVMSIQSGDNPRIVRQKLAIFLEPKMREAILAEA